MRTFTTAALIFLVPLFLFSQNSNVELSGNGICFPQMTTHERDLIVPVSGQCIFNIERNRLECYIEANQAWSGIQSLLSDADGDTQILVERSPDDDIIHMIGNGIDLLSIYPTDFGDTRIIPSAFGNNNELRYNIFLGAETGHDITSGINNVVIGVESAVGLSTGSDNTLVGTQSGRALDTGIGNTFVGKDSGNSTTSSSENAYFGARSGDRATGYANTFVGYLSGGNGPMQGNQNVFIGNRAGEEIHNSNKSVYIGYGAGSDSDGDNNVFIGHNAGFNLNTNSKLIIESDPFYDTNGEQSLIYGDFAEDFVTINGMLNVSQLLKLEVMVTEPVCNEERHGSIYMNALTDRLNLCTSLGWKAIALEP